jgi:hypothetical protein
VGGSHLDFDEKRDLTSAQQAAFDSGQYGKNYGLVETDEANSRAWSIFKSANNPGQIVYLSSGFVNQNLDLIKKNGYGIMAYGNEGYDINTVDTEAGYN